MKHVDPSITRARLRWFVEQIRSPLARAGQLALDAGYASYHNLSDALMRRTDHRPSAVRTLTDEQIGELLRKQLSIPKLTAHN